MPRRWKYAVVGLGGVVLVLAVMWLSSENWFQPRTTQAEVRSLIEARLPLGSSVEQTLAFLDEQGWTTRSDPSPNRAAAGAGEAFEQQDPSGSTLSASIPDAYPAFIVSEGIYLEFGFDANGRLTRYEMADGYTFT